MNSVPKVKILSVDPRNVPVGLLHPEMTVRFLRSRGVVASALTARNSSMASSVFGVSANQSISGHLMMARSAWGIVVIASAILSLSGALGFAFPVWFSVMLLCYGIASIAGSLFRPLSVYVGVSAVIAALSVTSVLALSMSAVVALISFVFAGFGPGRYSVDRKLQIKLRDKLIASEIKGRHLDDYRAFARL